jgi:DNA adenine methylase
MIQRDSYPGGKNGNGVAQNIINHLPPHKTFVSGFAGKCGVFNHKKEAELNILNDIDSEVYEYWFIKLGNKFNTGVVNYPFLELINNSTYSRLFDMSDTLLYCDPPYLFSTRIQKRPIYTHEMSEDQHIEFLKSVLQLKCKVCISHYPNTIYDEYLKDWQIFDFKATTRKGGVIERIYMNYQLNGKLHDYSFVGDNFREREAFKRQKNNMVNKIEKMQPHFKNAMLANIVEKFNLNLK